MRKLAHIRLRPISVFLFHQVSETYDPKVCNPDDWMQVDQFKEKVMDLAKRYEFISLTEAFRHLGKDWLRWKQYAVLTSDDGSDSLKNVLPWLRERQIPITLFINAKYLDGVSYREKPSERYLCEKDLSALDYESIEIGHHGWTHENVTKQSWSQFVDSVNLSTESLSSHPRYIPFWAFTWGMQKQQHREYLRSRGIVPVLIDGMKNYDDVSVIHRELMGK